MSSKKAKLAVVARIMGHATNPGYEEARAEARIDEERSGGADVPDRGLEANRFTKLP